MSGRVHGNDATYGSGGFERTLAQPICFKEIRFIDRDYIVESHVRIWNISMSFTLFSNHDLVANTHLLAASEDKSGGAQRLILAATDFH